MSQKSLRLTSDELIILQDCAMRRAEDLQKLKYKIMAFTSDGITEDVVNILNNINSEIILVNTAKSKVGKIFESQFKGQNNEK